jgi:hypothetical protein
MWDMWRGDDHEDGLTIERARTRDIVVNGPAIMYANLQWMAER